MKQKETYLPKKGDTIKVTVNGYRLDKPVFYQFIVLRSCKGISKVFQVYDIKRKQERAMHHPQNRIESNDDGILETTMMPARILLIEKNAFE